VGINSRFPLEEAWFAGVYIQLRTFGIGSWEWNGEGADAFGFHKVCGSQGQGELFWTKFVFWVLD